MMKTNDEIKKSNPFKVPDGYFDTLTDRTMSAITESHDGEETAKGTGRPSRRIVLRPFLALAATILGFAILATVMIKLVTNDRASDQYEADNSLYADLAAEELDTYMIEYELNQTEPDDMRVANEEEISSEAIIDYLLMEDIDLNDIYELL
ncbi:MAG: hypothetical protein RBT02_12075 [Bacteroidales bacterium]|jgi:hypothetical protein|nr:hypothetical protein [Bacteroidales bacterium]